MTYELSLRLQACLASLYPLQIIGDIGTDHAYLPCIGILKSQIKKAIATDIGDGPLEMAKATINRYHLSEKIELRLGSGLTVLSPNEVEGIVIAGMGGKLISAILEENVALSKSFKRLVLQPNIDANLVRAWLAQQRFLIIDEKIVFEDNKFYEVIVAEPTSKPSHYTAFDLEFGPILRQRPNEKIFIAKWQKSLTKVEQILKTLPKSHPRTESLKIRRKQIREVLKL